MAFRVDLGKGTFSLLSLMFSFSKTFKKKLNYYFILLSMSCKKCYPLCIQLSSFNVIKQIFSMFSLFLINTLSPICKASAHEAFTISWIFCNSSPTHNNTPPLPSFFLTQNCRLTNPRKRGLATMHYGGNIVSTEFSLFLVSYIRNNAVVKLL